MQIINKQAHLTEVETLLFTALLNGFVESVNVQKKQGANVDSKTMRLFNMSDKLLKELMDKIDKNKNLD